MTIDNLLALCEAIGKPEPQPNLADYGFTHTDDGWKIEATEHDISINLLEAGDIIEEIIFSTTAASVTINGTIYEMSDFTLTDITLSSPIIISCTHTEDVDGYVLIKSLTVKNTKPWKCLKYCDSVTRDFQDAIKKNEFFVKNESNFAGFELIETQNEPIFQSNDKTTTFFSIEKTNVFSVVVDDDVKDVYDVVRKLDPSIKIPIKMGFKGNDHLISPGVFKYKLGEKVDIELYMSRKLQSSDYTISYYDKDDPSKTYESFNDMIQAIGTHRMHVECTGDYVGSAECEIIIEN